MGLFGLIFLIVALMLVGAGFVVALLVSIAVVILIAMGVVTSSSLIAFLSGRMTMGIRAFLLQCGALVGAVSGTGIVGFIEIFFTKFFEEGRFGIALLGGAISGAIVGLVITVTFELVLRRLLRRVSPVGLESLPNIRA